MPSPVLDDLVPAIEAAAPHLARATGGDPSTNVEGGDPVGHADPRLLARHLGNYLAAAEVAADRDVAAEHDVVLDVGCGTGAFSAWLAARLGVPLHLVDHDPRVLATAAANHDVAGTHGDLAGAPRAGVVTAMEVLEHVEPGAQPDFLAALCDRVAPGGVLVLSTPDETQYPGGWSGYAPHVGCVDAAGLGRLLHAAAGGRPVELWRLVGGPFDVPVHRRWLEAVGNRAWTALARVAPGAAAGLAGLGARGRPAPDGPAADAGPLEPVLDVGRVRGLHRVLVLPAEHGVGGSLVGVVRH